MNEEMNTNLQVANPYFFPFKNALLCYNSHTAESTLLNCTMHLQGCAAIDSHISEHLYHPEMKPRPRHSASPPPALLSP